MKRRHRKPSVGTSRISILLLRSSSALAQDMIPNILKNNYCFFVTKRTAQAFF